MTSHSSLDDTQLVKAWAAGNRAAGQALYCRYFDPLYRFFRDKAPEDYEDLIQGTLLECIDRHDRYRGEGTFRAFVFRTARLRLRRHLRAKHSDPLELEPSLGSVPGTDTRPSAVMARRSEHCLLREAMRRIPLDLQIAMELHYWEGMTTSELAVVLEIPDGTVKSRLRRGREALHAEILHPVQLSGVRRRDQGGTGDRPAPDAGRGGDARIARPHEPRRRRGHS